MKMFMLKNEGCWARCLWHMPIILATWEAEIRRILVQQGQPRQTVQMDWRCDSSNREPALQAWCSDFKPQSHLEKKGRSSRWDTYLALKCRENWDIFAVPILIFFNQVGESSNVRHWRHYSFAHTVFLNCFIIQCEESSDGVIQ
jgi:hypothetical protein